MKNHKLVSPERFAMDPERALANLFARAGARAEPDERYRVATERARAAVAVCEADLAGWRAARDEERALSRRIGEARAAGAPSDELLSRMRAHSTRRKELQQVVENLLARVLTLHASLEQKVDAGSNFDLRPPHIGSTVLRADRAADHYDVTNSPDAEAWDAYVAGHPSRTACHVHSFGDVAARTYGFLTPRLAALDADGRIAGVLPLVRLDHRLFGRALVSLPWVNYGGPLADTPRAETALLDAAAELVDSTRCDELEVRETRTRADWPELSHKLTMTLALPDTDAELDAALGASLRAQCAKASRAGATFATGGAELLDDFHAVMSVNMRDLGTPFHRKSFFAELLRALGPLVRLAVVRLDGQPAAAALLLVHGRTLEISWASALRRSKAHDPNMFLYRNILRDAIERGHDAFDFGRSSPDSPTLRFKEQWGAVPSPLYWHYRRADGGGPPDLDGERAKFDIAVAIWKRLPVPLARAFGAQLAPGLR